MQSKHIRGACYAAIPGRPTKPFSRSEWRNHRDPNGASSSATQRLRRRSVEQALTSGGNLTQKVRPYRLSFAFVYLTGHFQVSCVIQRLGPFGRTRIARGAGSLAYPAVLLIALCAPVETTEPWARLMGLKMSNVELVVGAALLLVACGSLLSGAALRWRTALTAPVTVLLALMSLSALEASYRGEALRHTGRFLAGFLVFLAVINAVKTRRQAAGIAVAVTAAGTLVALLGILERANVDPVIRLLEGLNPDRFVVGGSIRASSTLLYPTVASMYLEICFGLGLAVLLLCLEGRRTIFATLTFASLLVIFQGIVSTMTRSGVALVFVMLTSVTICLAYRRRFDRSTRAVSLLGAATVLLFIGTGGREPSLWLRSSGAEQANWYRAGFHVPQSLELETGRLHELEIDVTNQGSETWDSGKEDPFRLSYHWLTDKGDGGPVVVLDGLRTALPTRVEPGQTVRVLARIQPPPEPGRYQLAFDVVHEHRFWFAAQGSALGLVPATITGQPLGRGHFHAQTLPGSEVSVDRLALWKIGWRMLLAHPLLGVGPDNFRMTYGRYLGLRQWDTRVHSNSMYVELFACTGLLGGVAFLWLAWRALAALGRSLRSSSALDLALPAGIMAAELAFFGHGFTDYFLGFTPTYLVVWLTLGLGISLVETPRERTDANSL